MYQLFELRLKDLNDRKLKSSATISCRFGGQAEALSTALAIIPRSSGSRTDEFIRSVCTLEAKDDGEHRDLSLHIQLFWIGNSGAYALPPIDKFFQQILRPPDGNQPRSWSLSDFYDNVHVPDSASLPCDAIQHALLSSQLYPFQNRAVQWLLQREGVQCEKNGEINPYLADASERATSHVRTKDALGCDMYVSRLFCDIQSNAQRLPALLPPLAGGILAEEMGLGKSVQLIALICIHRRNMASTDSPKVAASNLARSGATLIITPPSILRQWEAEIKKHAPSLKVLNYEGVRANESNMNAPRKKLLGYDIVLTTYAVLSSEMHYANEIPERYLRRTKVYEQRRSPLVEIDWWRVCLDEAQMVENGVSNAAKVARLIPRRNSWAVSGTPLRKDVNDLFGLLLFLNYEPFCVQRVWNRMLSGHQEDVKKLFGKIAMRHTKAKVRAEIHLPPQKRVIIRMPFTAIEEQNYSQLFQQMCDDSGLDTDGGPLYEDWNPERYTETMRHWLTRLRQTCLHPEIGLSNRRAFGHREGPLRSVDEVLEIMIDQNETALRVEERAVLMSTVMRGHLHSFGKKSQEAFRLYSEALKKAEIVVDDCREQLNLETTKGAALRRADIESKDLSPLQEDNKDEVEEQNTRLPVLRQRLRSALEVLHVCLFFTASATYQIKSNAELTVEDSEEFKALDIKEADLYEQAKRVRKELLVEISAKATSMMKRVLELKTAKPVTLPIINHFENTRGIESRQIVEEVEELRSFLNRQAKQLEDWRRTLIDLLLARLVDQDEEQEMTGEEYELSTKSQDTQYVYIDALRASFADRNHMINGVYSLLIDVEMKGALKIALEGGGHDPELFKSISNTRSQLKLPQDSSLSLRGVIAELRNLIGSVRWLEGERGSNRAAIEAAVLERELHNLNNVTTSQAKALVSLEKELDIFRSTMNQRLEFYRQLQHISDMVAPLQEEMNDDVDEVKVEAELQKETKHAEKLSTLKIKRRFLLHLRADSSRHEEQRICVICQSDFDVGVLTVCGHQYCKECINLWWSEHHNCPMCKHVLKSADFHNITYKPQELRADEERPNGASQGGQDSSITQSKSSIYSSISTIELNSIKSIDLPGSFGTKIDTLSRHLLWLRDADPGAKSIIFSQYRDFLQVLSRAFNRFKIGYASISDKHGIESFKEDPSVQCFLLHAKADSSGLNLTNATHVFLCEPLINAALELQAIARVHRIGQRRPTTVWMYLISNTVEEAIYDLSVSRRMAHMQRSTSTPLKANKSRATTPTAKVEHSDLEAEIMLDTANSLELQTAPMSGLMTKNQSGGEVVSNDDLWSCLFGKVRSKEDIAVGNEVEQEIGRGLRQAAAEGRRVEEDQA